MEKLLRKNRCKGTGQTGTNQSGKIILQGVIIMFGLFKKKQQITPETGTKRKIVRSFIGARNTAFNRFQTTLATINQELK